MHSKTGTSHCGNDPSKRIPEEACDRNRALIVDDEKEIAALFKSFLLSAMPNLTVDLAHDGKEAVDSFSKLHHGVLLMDLHMPVMDGTASVNEIKSLCRVRNWEPPAVVFCTGFAASDVKAQLEKEHPGHALVAKPVMGDVIVRAVQDRLRKEE